MPLSLAKELIARRSVTPEDAGCQNYLVERLQKSAFHAEFFNCQGVSNVWLRRGKESPLFVFAGHTDVVPPGDEEAWNSPPFVPTLQDGLLYGRGAADMKGGLSAMVVAFERFAAEHPDHKGSIALLLTSDEEGQGIHGTRYVIEQLAERKEQINWCVIGEPSATAAVGDTIRIGRRGSLTGYLTVKGEQSHVAYAERDANPIRQLVAVLERLCQIEWDQGNDYFPPTSFQLCKVQADAGADNVIPGTVHVTFNARYSTEITDDEIRRRIIKVLDESHVQYEIDWHLSGQPFLTKPGVLVQAVSDAISEITEQNAELSAGGGTSDGRFIAPTGTEVVELGPVNATIHQVNECVAAEDLETLAQIYQRILEKLLR